MKYKYPKIYERVIRDRNLFIAETTKENLFEFMDILGYYSSLKKDSVHSDLIDGKLILTTNYSFIHPNDIYSYNNIFCIDYKYSKDNIKDYKLDIEDFLKYHKLFNTTIGEYLRDNVYVLL